MNTMFKRQKAIYRIKVADVSIIRLAVNLGKMKRQFQGDAIMTYNLL